MIRTRLYGLSKRQKESMIESTSSANSRKDNEKHLCGSTGGQKLPGRGACISIPPAENKPMSSRPIGIMGWELWCLDWADSMSSSQEEERGKGGGRGGRRLKNHGQLRHSPYMFRTAVGLEGNLGMKLTRSEVHWYNKAAEQKKQTIFLNWNVKHYYIHKQLPVFAQNQLLQYQNFDFDTNTSCSIIILNSQK